VQPVNINTAMANASVDAMSSSADVAVGSLFTGYGGLDIAVMSYFGGELSWYAEVDKPACKVLAAHYPGTTNLSDVTAVDWSSVAAIDVLTAGYPCQPFSHAGKREGKNDERHLWPYVADAIDALRPGVVVLENVRGHLSLGFGDVLADLSRLGYDARWGVVRASDAGAPHGRARIFIVAYSNRTGPQGADAGLDVGAGRRDAGGHPAESTHCTPADAASAEWGGTESEYLGTRSQGTTELGERISVDWGQYEAAIRRWERTLNRPAPRPTIAASNGKLRLSPIFVEWMMGLPEGWVTGHGLSSSQCLKMLGNGVVPQQAILALNCLNNL